MPSRSFGVFTHALRSEEPAERPAVRQAAAELQDLGYACVWLGGSSSVRHAAHVIEHTSRITVATGITNIWFDAAEDVARDRAALEAAHPGRFLLGLGASHAELARDYRRPYSAMVAYLDRLDAAGTPVPAEGRVLAALGPRMLTLSAERAAGAHPYLVNPDFVRQARDVMGPDALLAPEVTVVAEKDPTQARARAREWIEYYLVLPNYLANLRRLGFSDEDFEAGGSDRLIDSLVVWGDEETVARKIRAYHDAGADHVALQVLSTREEEFTPLVEWRLLAGLLGLT
ncbi:LLM class F420-dependent oxidoreductase [Streptomyces sp. PLK6-54]|uniref:LLM class F420-dependent oxidoreductase n=1 Tax=Actinacidiphila acidipaludis TaxID=2873382 RepID=A0ABS7QD51_9ACTN|nr:LLM class F420-dependent oxidoreductase [Streptomyces acidipaludis]